MENPVDLIHYYDFIEFLKISFPFEIVETMSKNVRVTQFKNINNLNLCINKIFHFQFIRINWIIVGSGWIQWT